MWREEISALKEPPWVLPHDPTVKHHPCLDCSRPFAYLLMNDPIETQSKTADCHDLQNENLNLTRSRAACLDQHQTFSFCGVAVECPMNACQQTARPFHDWTMIF